MTRTVTREQVLGHRFRAQQLGRAVGSVADTAVLDLGVQDTGPDGARWALAVRGVREIEVDALVTAWTLRGAPHVYRRADLPSVARAVEPFSDADAGKRIFDAIKPLKAAGIANLEALDVVAAALREVVTEPTVKGDASGRLNALLPAPYQRNCGPCGVVHVYEMPFRLAALRAGLELRPGTSPPVLEPVPGFTVAEQAEARHDVVRAVLHLLGPATPKQVAGYLDAPLADVKTRWPDDADEVDVDGERRWALADDVGSLSDGAAHAVRLLGPYDLYLQGRDRELLVADAGQRKQLWPVLGRPGAVVVGGEVVGTWRPRQSGKKLGVQVTQWSRWKAAVRAAVQEQAEALAAFRGVAFTGLQAPG